MKSSILQDAADATTSTLDGPAITVRDLVKDYVGASTGKERGPAVDGVTFEVQKREFFTLLGPSGCGKSTTLRSVAGLEKPNEGDIFLGGQHVFGAQERIDVATHRRKVGMVFQSYAIWPHMSVFENVAFPLRVRPWRARPTSREIREAVQNALDVVEMGDLSERSATMLSGGQQQRLALARAMVDNPEVMLLDEPLSNLDAKLRDSMRLELRRLQERSGFSALYVTHDQVEALALSNRIAVMNNGKIEQIGGPRDIYERPETEFVAKFVGRTNFLEVKILEAPDESSQRHLVDAGIGQSFVALSDDRRESGSSATVCVRPEHITLTPGGNASIDATFQGEVVSVQFLGESSEYIVDVAGHQLSVRTGPFAELSPGTSVRVAFHELSCRLVHES